MTSLRPAQPADRNRNALAELRLGDQPLALTRKSYVYHVGTLDPAHKGCHGPSHEGNGLSVSLHPDEWTAIAQLGGLPRWALARRGGFFLDFHELTDTQRDLIRDWAIEHGYLEAITVWQVRRYDDELEDTVCFLFDTHEEAYAEFDSTDDDAGLSPVDGVRALPKLDERMGFKVDLAGAFDAAVLVWVEETTQLDGIWWDDLLDEERLSAPRGVITLSALPHWERELLQPGT